MFSAFRKNTTANIRKKYLSAKISRIKVTWEGKTDNPKGVSFRDTPFGLFLHTCGSAASNSVYSPEAAMERRIEIPGYSCGE